MNDTTTALLTGASAGFGRALAFALAERGWDLILTARQLEPLTRVRDATGAVAVAGDVADPGHRAALARVIGELDRLDLVVNNASALGPSPMPALADYPPDELLGVLTTNVVAPLSILQLTRPMLLAANGIAVNISSDAAVNAYEGWGGYGSSKAALDQLTAVYAAENPGLRVYALDPGDMRTAMHQAAFPGEDISDRPEPETVVPAFLHLLDHRPPSGRYLAADLLPAR
ncbi:SDR family NAD(P)-dependent oxidoreductase [Nocardia sp. alder85J]|uniref:SDR family NAD(P)-dependent oxidoreductase n=1 Tax=Nocardia sp. alder85J TaxID=2862949 RepID=UPI001CD6692D|nr:SDR family oxidoreductase [Nocardia sp. alder85J]MCX4097434.1 SDR family NAD(P)-dependent oxidoreductase [Nocardia sp. alder85J]